jgi:hypothetical protein
MSQVVCYAVLTTHWHEGQHYTKAFRNWNHGGVAHWGRITAATHTNPPAPQISTDLPELADLRQYLVAEN